MAETVTIEDAMNSILRRICSATPTNSTNYLELADAYLKLAQAKRLVAG